MVKAKTPVDPQKVWKQELAKTAANKLVAEFDQMLKAAKLPYGDPEYRFSEIRKWRLDRVWLFDEDDPRQKRGRKGVALEIHGGTWSGGRHVRGKGYEEDRRKMNEAQLAGFIVLEATKEMIKDGSAIKYVKRALSGESDKRRR